MRTVRELENTNGELETLMEKSSEHATIRLQTTADKLELYISITLRNPDARHTFTREELLSIIFSCAEKSLINIACIDKIVNELNSQTNVSARLIARGRAPVPGQDSKLILFVKKFEGFSRPGKQVEFVDSRFIRAFDNIEKDNIIGKIRPPNSAINGLDVIGEMSVPQKGKATQPTVDKTIELVAEDADGAETMLIAKERGYLTSDSSGRLSISPHLAIEGNVDFKTGDLDFIGSIEITGDVANGFKVVAGGNISVAGNINNGMLVSRNGSIAIQGCVTGSETRSLSAAKQLKARRETKGESRLLDIYSAGNLSASIVAGANIFAQGDIIIKTELRESIARTQCALRIPQGHILGGEIFAICGIEAGTIGSAGGSNTTINLVGDPKSSIEYRQLESQIEYFKNAENLIQLYLAPYVAALQKNIRLAQSQKAYIETMIRSLTAVTKRIDELQEKQKALTESSQVQRSFKVSFHKTLYAGTQIVANRKIFAPDSNIDGPKTVEYRPNERDFIVRDFSKIDCSAKESGKELGQQNKNLEKKA
ncbi:MAG: DUF342 domain-containing protein [Deltaproteobacteria bacterium]|nr:DUF342 domain-containing protein [Deltaproteobacteria bacterium]